MTEAHYKREFVQFHGILSAVCPFCGEKMMAVINHPAGGDVVEGNCKHFRGINFENRDFSFIIQVEDNETGH